MKKITVGLLLLILSGCQASDQEIKADIASKAQQDLNFAGLDYTVNNGAVNFSGRCPSQKAFDDVRQAVKNIHIIKSVNYKVVIAPVVLDTLTPVKLQADSLIAQYPKIKAQVSVEGIVLKGTASVNEKLSLFKSFMKMHLGPLKDSVNLYYKQP